ncbi:MAG: sulfatase-like hydrolase/transferase [Verrucomicrobiae bacterium]|nr:sulfatase-like hydrolase/transferase [Verrucomicrobiae bacterium]
MKTLAPLLASACVICGQLSSAASPSQHPNILIILTDDMGYGDIGAHGCKDIPTPHIDSLAKNGARFTNAYAAGSFCTPTRAALMSGRYPQRSGNEDLDGVTGPLPRAVGTLPQRLRAAGYITGMAGKWHLGHAEGFRPTERGFDEFYGIFGGGVANNIPGLPAGKGKRGGPVMVVRGVTPEPATEYLQDAWGREAVRFVEAHRGQKWFFYLAFNAVHVPVQATEKYLKRFAHIEDRQRRVYAAMLSAVDDAVGAVLAALRETGQLERTLIFFHNDNGGPTTRNGVNGSRNTPLRGSKCETFEGGIRVPLLAQWPRVIKPGTVYRQPVITMDITATALAAADACGDTLDGVNLLPHLRGEKDGAPHEALFWRCRTRSNNFAARQGDWKMVWSTEGAEQPGPNQKPARFMLFNLAEDLGEQNDLAAKHPDKLAALRKLWEAWSAEVDADCRKLGIEPKMEDLSAKPAPKRQAKKAGQGG